MMGIKVFYNDKTGRVRMKSIRILDHDVTGVKKEVYRVYLDKWRYVEVEVEL